MARRGVKPAMIGARGPDGEGRADLAQWRRDRSRPHLGALRLRLGDVIDHWTNAPVCPSLRCGRPHRCPLRGDYHGPALCPLRYPCCLCSKAVAPVRLVCRPQLHNGSARSESMGRARRELPAAPADQCSDTGSRASLSGSGSPVPAGPRERGGRHLSPSRRSRWFSDDTAQPLRPVLRGPADRALPS